jgi:curved DNA-binding protein CbpA
MSAPGGRTLPAFDVYDELGLGRDASSDQVQSAYRRRAKEHHPDVASDAAAAEARMKRINQARDVLLDPARRAEYDRLRASPSAPGAGPAGARPASRRPAASTAPSGAADTAAAQAERERRARADQERRARARAEQDRWEREAEARAARDVAARARRRRGEPVTAAGSGPERGREPRTAARSGSERRGARAGDRRPAGPAPRAWTDLRTWLGGRVTVEIRVLGDDGIRRWTASRSKDRA